MSKLWFQNQIFPWLQRGWTLLERLNPLVVIGFALAMFALAVSIDSAENLAAAADLRQPQPMTAAMVEVEGPTSTAEQNRQLATVLQGRSSTVANRLRHSAITSPVMTRSHLTRAHLFSDFSALP